jgi:hypothetical protein
MPQNSGDQFAGIYQLTGSLVQDDGQLLCIFNEELMVSLNYAQYSLLVNGTTTIRLPLDREFSFMQSGNIAQVLG